MKFARIIVTVFICSAFLVSCKSKEDKAAELIRNELSKTLYDFDSYQPIETVVKVAKVNAYNDSTCWHKAGVLAYGLSQVIKSVEKASNAIEHMQIWGRPTYYSSSYSDNQYYKYKSEHEEAVAETNISIILCNSIASELKDSIAQLDTSQVAGWEVNHSFRCKTKGGNSEIAHYRYVISKDFKKVILREDTESKDDKSIRDALTSVVNGWEDLKTIQL